MIGLSGPAGSVTIIALWLACMAAKNRSLRLADSIANSIPSTTGFFFVAKVHLQIRGMCSMDRENAAQCHQRARRP